MTKIAPEEGLAFLLNNNFSRGQYKAVRAKSKGDGADIWPSYQSVQNAKLECRPTEISVEDHFAVVPLQNLLDHTTRRIVKSNLDLEAKMFQMAEQNGGQLSATLYYKYGFDGSGSHHRAMQPDAEGDQPEGKSLYATQMVPLRLVANSSSEEVILYDNERPNNPHSSRPVRLVFKTENSASIQAENQRLKQEINSLEKFVLSEDPKVEIEFKGLLTMVDGKVVLL